MISQKSSGSRDTSPGTSGSASTGTPPPETPSNPSSYGGLDPTGMSDVHPAVKEYISRFSPSATTATTPRVDSYTHSKMFIGPFVSSFAADVPSGAEPSMGGLPAFQESSKLPLEQNFTQPGALNDGSLQQLYAGTFVDGMSTSYGVNEHVVSTTTGNGGAGAINDDWMVFLQESGLL